MGKKNKKREAPQTSPSPSTSPSSSPSPSPSPSSSTSTSPSPSDSPPSPPPISSARLPLLDLSPGDLGAFFELCFPDKRLVALCHELQLHTPGYRLEALPPDQVARDPLQHLARIAWRALLTPGEPERRMALEAIDEGVRALDAPAQQKKPPRKAPPPGQKEA